MGDCIRVPQPWTLVEYGHYLGLDDAGNELYSLDGRRYALVEVFAPESELRAYVEDRTPQRS